VLFGVDKDWLSFVQGWGVGFSAANLSLRLRKYEHSTAQDVELEQTGMNSSITKCEGFKVFTSNAVRSLKQPPKVLQIISIRVRTSQETRYIDETFNDV
jgi:hypothetical protein